MTRQNCCGKCFFQVLISKTCLHFIQFLEEIVNFFVWNHIENIFQWFLMFLNEIFFEKNFGFEATKTQLDLTQLPATADSVENWKLENSKIQKIVSNSWKVKRFLVKKIREFWLWFSFWLIFGWQFDRFAGVFKKIQVDFELSSFLV